MKEFQVSIFITLEDGSEKRYSESVREHNMIDAIQNTLKQAVPDITVEMLTAKGVSISVGV